MNVTERLRSAVAALSRGDLAGARVEAEAALKKQPNSPSVLQVLGVIYCQTGEVRQGADYLRKAIRRGADTIDNRLNLTRALLELGELDEAEKACRAPAGAAEPAVLQRLRADIRKAQGRHVEAIGLYEQIVQQSPNDFESWNNLGNARLAAGDAAGALEALEQSRALNPNNGVVHINIARALDALGSHSEGLAGLQHAARQSPGDASVQLELGKALLRMGRSDEALAPLGTAARLNPANAETFVFLGLTFASLAQADQAERSYRFALKADPRNVEAFLNLAILLEQANRIDEVARLAEYAEANALSLDERNYVRAMLLRRDGRLSEALELAQSVHSPKLDSAIKMLFVGQVADRLGDTDTAFYAFAEMNRLRALRPEAQRFNGTEQRRHVERLAAITPEWIGTWQPAEPSLDVPAPAVLVGFMRSGTTLLDTILMGHDGTHVLEEEPILSRIESAIGDLSRLARLDRSQLDLLRRRYLDEAAAVRPMAPGSLLIDKNPLASLQAPLIHRLFPGARFIFALRHPCDVVLSCWMQNLQVNQAMASFLDLTNAALFYDSVMSYWHQCQDLLPLSVHTVRYEDLVDDVEAEVRPLLDFLGLEWDDKVLNHQRSASERGYIRTPSYAQVTEKIYSRASGRWVRYRHHLEPILPILSPWAERFGYAMD